ncbi:fumarylacetoacetate hydrolase family protein [Streptomyces sp. Lzd4kr]|nr:fumarylacetoacetate hydrolase family protein [Streptomyces sp. Lzd4kr]
MRIVRFRRQRETASGDGPVAGFGLAEGDVRHQVSDPFTGRTPRPTGRTLPHESVGLLAPTEPGLVMGRARDGESGEHRLPPNVFLEEPGSVIGPDGQTPLSGHVGRVHAEGELAVVIGHTARNPAVGGALDRVLGHILGNDVTARGLHADDPPGQGPRRLHAARAVHRIRPGRRRRGPRGQHRRPIPPRRLDRPARPGAPTYPIAAAPATSPPSRPHSVIRKDNQ